MSEKKTISVMIPLLNEQNARPIYEAVRDELVKSARTTTMILFIDNKSEDGTRAIIRQICAEDKHVKAIFNVKNLASSTARTRHDPHLRRLHDHDVRRLPGPCGDDPQVCGRVGKGLQNRHPQDPEQGKPGHVIAARLLLKLIKKMSAAADRAVHWLWPVRQELYPDAAQPEGSDTLHPRHCGRAGPERKEIEYTQPQRRAGKTHNNWYSLYDAAMLSFTSHTKAGMRIATFAGFLVAGLELSGRPVLI